MAFVSDWALSPVMKINWSFHFFPARYNPAVAIALGVVFGTLGLLLIIALLAAGICTVMPGCYLHHKIKRRHYKGMSQFCPLACKPLERMHIGKPCIVCNRFMHDCVFSWCCNSQSVSVCVYKLIYILLIYSLRNSVRKVLCVCFC